MLCANCGATLSDGTKFCSECGVATDISKSQDASEDIVYSNDSTSESVNNDEFEYSSSEVEDERSLDDYKKEKKALRKERKLAKKELKAKYKLQKEKAKHHVYSAINGEYSEKKHSSASSDGETFEKTSNKQSLVAISDKEDESFEYSHDSEAPVASSEDKVDFLILFLVALGTIIVTLFISALLGMAVGIAAWLIFRTKKPKAAKKYLLAGILTWVVFILLWIIGSAIVGIISGIISLLVAAIGIIPAIAEILGNLSDLANNSSNAMNSSANFFDSLSAFLNNIRSIFG